MKREAKASETSPSFQNLITNGRVSPSKKARGRKTCFDFDFHCTGAS